MSLGNDDDDDDDESIEDLRFSNLIGKLLKIILNDSSRVVL